MLFKEIETVMRALPTPRSAGSEGLPGGAGLAANNLRVAKMSGALESAYNAERTLVVYAAKRSKASDLTFLVLWPVLAQPADCVR
jgi:hypothetical protein